MPRSSRVGGSSLLDSYESERRPIAERNTRAARAIADHIGNIAVPVALEENNEAGRPARQTLEHTIRATFATHYQTIGVQLGARYDASSIIIGDGVAPPADRPDLYTPSACPGGRAPHVDLPGEGPLFDRFGSGFTLLRARGADSELIERAAAQRGVPLTVVALDCADVIGAYERKLVLIRPDQHVAWRNDSAPDDPIALIGAVRGAL